MARWYAEDDKYTSVLHNLFNDNDFFCVRLNVKVESKYS